MVKCSFCNHENPENVLFCERCKTELAAPALATYLPADETAHTEAKKSLNEDIDSEFLMEKTLPFQDIPLVEPVDRDKGKSKNQRPRLIPEDRGAPIAPTNAGTSLDVTQNVDDGYPHATQAAAHEALTVDSKPRLVVLRGEKIHMQYPIYAGKNFIGRTDDKPVDIDLENQEPADRIWTSRQHAVITFENAILTIEDLNSLNGTFVNRLRVYPGQVRKLQLNDVIQVGTVHLRVIVG